MIHGMVLARNEAGEGRWLKQFITQMRLICDRVVVLDDASTDNTADIFNDMGCEVYHSEKSLWGVNELIQRKSLWEETIKKANVDDWILCLDCDELFVPEHIDYIKYMFKAVDRLIYENNNGIVFKLFDMWNEHQYREDEYWNAHRTYWPFAVKYNENHKYKWLEKKLHCGRFPSSSYRYIATQIPVKHMGWSTQEFRQIKYDRYMKIDPEGKEGILEQYKSILDENPNLVDF